jgi:hypothetical protein
LNPREYRDEKAAIARTNPELNARQCHPCTDYAQGYPQSRWITEKFFCVTRLRKTLKPDRERLLAEN